MNRYTKLTPNFTLAEFIKPGTPLPSQEILNNIQRLAERLQVVRDYYGAKVTITSGWRTVVHNAEVGGASNSKHLTGEAADIDVEGVPPRQVQKDFRHWSGGMGSAATFTHLDIRPTLARWTY